MKPVVACPSTEQLIAFGQGRLSVEESEPIERHLADCDRCGAALAALPADTFMNLAREAATQAFERAPGEAGRAGGGPAATATGGEAAGESAPIDAPLELRDHARYRLLGLVGVGGMGAVYKARHRVMDRLVALKVIRPALVSHPRAVERFQREVTAAARLSHPNIVTAYDAEQSGEVHFLVMEYVDGVSLDRFVAHNGPLSPQQAANLIRQAAQGLEHARQRGMVHRDIKPQNLMITRQGELKILDFGLARLATESSEEPSFEVGSSGDAGGRRAVDRSQRTQAGALLGTPDYLAPEQARDARSADIRADIYSLGCTFFYLLTGRAPFAGRDATEKRRLHATIDPAALLAERPEIPASLAALLGRMLARDPADRFQTPAEAAQALTAFRKSSSGGRSAASAPVAPAPTWEPLAAPDLFAAPDPLAAPDLFAAASPVGAPYPGGAAGLASGGSAAAAFRTGLRGAPLAAQVGSWVRAASGSRGRVGLAAGAAGLLAIVLLFACLPLIVSRSPGPAPAPANGSTWSHADSHGAAGGRDDGSPLATDRAGDSYGAAGAAVPAARARRVLFVIPKRDVWYADYGPLRGRIERDGRFKVITASTEAGECVAHPMSNGGGAPIIADVEFSAELFDRDAYVAVVFLGADARPFASGSHRAQTQAVLERMRSSGRPVAAICLGQTALIAQGALRDRDAAWGEYLAPYEQSSGARWDRVRPAVVDRSGGFPLITAGADRHVDAFAAALLAELGPD